MMNFPQAIPSVIKAIEKSGMNLNPQQDGTTLFIPVPKYENKKHSVLLIFNKIKLLLFSESQKNIERI